ncbi:ferric reductase-like transmembrane domain-containing protein [Nocardioides pocheonensis]|uniref:Ferric reductase n=1 Tax=Nocardioides pocheonensis TaxID=661485 RepID=A0A3N0GTH2_9ACTN|nr:ferric reductase-like transmembrane domain-containing protein [Nocardioides pocheonensis]RNM15765.1 ferric reductase [Nocardioides pocheonensis]
MLSSFVQQISHGPMLWYLNRGSGVALLLVLTATLCLGILSARAGRSRLVPRFVGQQLHRNLGVLALVLVVGHVATAVADTYVDIRWWQAVSPVGATYKPLWLGLGSLSFDVMLLVVLTSLLRHRMGQRSWHAVHLLGYLSWPLAVVHSVGIGTDASSVWGRQVGLGCVAAVAAVSLIRVASDLLAGRRRPADLTGASL